MVGRNFAADCVKYTAAELVLGSAEEATVTEATELARRAAAGQILLIELAKAWRSVRLPVRDGPSGMILRAAKACIFPGGVAESARHAAVCAARARAGEEEPVRRWQAAKFREWLLRQRSPNQALHLTRPA